MATNGESLNQSAPPAMILWPEKFLGSTRVQSLHGLDRGVYLLMLVAEWQFNGRGLPADPGELGRVLGLPRKALRRSLGSLQAFFRCHEDRLYNDRLEHELKAAKERGQRLSEKGRNAAAMRWAMPDTCHPSPSPSEEPSLNPSRQAGGTSSLRSGRDPERRERRRLIAAILRQGYRTDHVSAGTEGLEGGAGVERWEEISTERLRGMLP